MPWMIGSGVFRVRAMDETVKSRASRKIRKVTFRRIGVSGRFQAMSLKIGTFMSSDCAEMFQKFVLGDSKTVIFGLSIFSHIPHIHTTWGCRPTPCVCGVYVNRTNAI